MFPYRDDNPTLAHALRHADPHWAQRGGVGAGAGNGRGAAALALGVRARAHPGRVPRPAARREPPFPMGPHTVCVLGDEQTWYHAAHLDVPPRRLVPPHRQHVVPLGLREQRGRLDGAHPLPRLLHPVRAGRCRGPDLHESVERHSDGRRLRRDQRRDGRLHRALPQGSGPHAGGPGHLHHPHRGAGLPDAGLLVPAPAPRRRADQRIRRAAWRSGPTPAGSSLGRC